MAHLSTDIPDFVDQELSTGDSLDAIRDRLQSMNWLSVALVNEITSLFPTAADVNVLSFAEKCLLSFPKGCVFASEKQIDQVADMFMDGWACVRRVMMERRLCVTMVFRRRRKRSMLWILCSHVR